MDLNLFYCKHCNKIIAVIENPDVVTVCCGEPMRPLRPSMTDGSAEKHVPQIKVRDNCVSVTVGKEPHPMEKDHFIHWILLETTAGRQRKILHPDDRPGADFLISKDERVKAVYCYCNLHKLWENEVA